MILHLEMEMGCFNSSIYSYKDSHQLLQESGIIESKRQKRTKLSKLNYFSNCTFMPSLFN